MEEPDFNEIKDEKIKSIYPLIGSVTIKGDFDLHNQKTILDLPNLIENINSPEYTINSGNSAPVEANKDPKDTLNKSVALHIESTKHCSTVKRATNTKSMIKHPTSLLDCYAGWSETIRRTPGGDSYWVKLSPIDEDPDRNNLRYEISCIEGEIDQAMLKIQHNKSQDNKADGSSQNKEKDFNLKYRPNCKSPERKIVSTNNDNKSEDNGTLRNEHDLRPRETLKQPERYEAVVQGDMGIPGQYPILIKGTTANYIPWGSLDLTGLIARLPEIQVGAGRWIRSFEAETTGILLALGDLKAVWSRTIGLTVMQTMLEAHGHAWMNQPRADGIEFNAYRNAIWTMLRAQYPSRLDPNSLKAESLLEDENPATYVDKQLKRWRLETEEDPNESPVMTTLFRSALVSAMPTP
ncbi:uncharacterized protein LOC106528484, partial [Austrofundulus limnaeus]|uniref:Uncharacterized protein LOC106528484 n=1 Tax=Austrofundulus limnaeus TaxID=52670 RepID=A0A2I4CGK0_AUSLI